MHLIRILLIASLLLPITAAAKTVTVRGEGNASCSSWTQEHALGSNRQRDQDNWLLGYVNATSVMLDIPGIDDVSARKLLLFAFASECLDRMKYGPVRTHVEAVINQSLLQVANVPGIWKERKQEDVGRTWEEVG